MAYTKDDFDLKSGQIVLRRESDGTWAGRIEGAKGVHKTNKALVIEHIPDITIPHDKIPVAITSAADTALLKLLARKATLLDAEEDLSYTPEETSL